MYVYVYTSVQLNGETKLTYDYSGVPFWGSMRCSKLAAGEIENVGRQQVAGRFPQHCFPLRNIIRRLSERVLMWGPDLSMFFLCS